MFYTSNTIHQNSDPKIVTLYCRTPYEQIYILVYENCAFLGYFATSSGYFLPTFRGNLSVPSSGDNNP